MGVLLFVGVVVLIAGITAATVLAVNARRDYRSANELIPGRPSTAPPEWAGAHTPEARLHRRLVDVVAGLRAQPLLEEGTGRLEARVELEERAADIDERLVAAAALPERVREQPMADLAAEVEKATGRRVEIVNVTELLRLAHGVESGDGKQRRA